ncbi:Cd(II)/Pb(II)-responsive transcriptional regulator [Xylophilus sp. GOD-11R]|uniref:Cd(II)/Pb(II)-responsive transcriptional regulator n=1 Tax=Xylophilus sp. GOD-11R TaxID=3089814 RepID=UPI00298D2256|nr:Cd(II)/Pb(II)-responsive transcriptional regulator [Xylophilus sp. GOD-11R]WPB59431.1 Cd(II)/Pb(II)-responsive transcriptional regulator [Xylophilus sp. GOD-11R]
MPSPSPYLRIGDAARLSGIGAANIRFYEREGLLAPQARSEAAYRLYGEEDIHRLRFIRLCRAMDMSLDEVRTLLGLDLNDKADCGQARETLEGHLEHVRQRLTELRSLEANLVALRDRCDGQGGHCGIIETLHRRADAQALPAATPVTRRHV